MAKSKKDAADRFAELETLYKGGKLSADEFDNAKKGLLNEVVYKESDSVGELSKWADFHTRGLLTDGEFAARKAVLLNPDKPSKKDPAPTPTPTPTKKKRGCGFYIMMGVGGIILFNLALGGLRSCVMSNNRQSTPKQPSMTQRGVSGTLRANAQEEQKVDMGQVRADFNKKIALHSGDVQTTAALNAGFDYLNAYHQMLTTSFHKDYSQKDGFLVQMNALEKELSANDPKIWRMVREVADEMTKTCVRETGKKTREGRPVYEVFQAPKPMAEYADGLANLNAQQAQMGQKYQQQTR